MSKVMKRDLFFLIWVALKQAQGQAYLSLKILKAQVLLAKQIKLYSFLKGQISFVQVLMDQNCLNLHLKDERSFSLVKDRYSLVGD